MEEVAGMVREVVMARAIAMGETAAVTVHAQGVMDVVHRAAITGMTVAAHRATAGMTVVATAMRRAATAGMTACRAAIIAATVHKAVITGMTVAVRRATAEAGARVEETALTVIPMIRIQRQRSRYAARKAVSVLR